MVNDPEAGVTVTVELRVMILFDRYNELLTVRLNPLLLFLGQPKNDLSTHGPLSPHP